MIEILVMFEAILSGMLLALGFYAVVTLLLVWFINCAVEKQRSREEDDEDKMWGKGSFLHSTKPNKTDEE